MQGQYQKEIRQHLNYSATWLPNTKVSVGDVGTLEKFEYHHSTTLKDLGIPFQSEKGGFAADHHYESKGALQAQVKLSGDAPIAGSLLAKADAGVSFKFLREGATLLRIGGCSSQRIRNQYEIEKEVLAREKRGEWPDNWVVVTEVVTAEQGFVAISRTKNAQLDLKAGATAGAESLKLASVQTNLRLVDNHHSCHTTKMKKNTPLFRAFGIRRRLPFSRPDFGMKFITSDFTNFAASVPEVTFDEVDYEDFE